MIIFLYQKKIKHHIAENTERGLKLQPTQSLAAAISSSTSIQKHSDCLVGTPYPFFINDQIKAHVIFSFYLPFSSKKHNGLPNITAWLANNNYH